MTSKLRTRWRTGSARGWPGANPVPTAVRLALLVAMAGCSVQPPGAAPAPDASQGYLFIVGGGPQPAEMVRHFVELAGGPGRARIAVIPMASASPDEAGREKVEQLREYGADAFALNLTRAQAQTDSAARLLDGVTGVWFSGGDQARLAPVLAGTPTLAAIHARYRAGATIGGTSAGAAIMSDSMITGEQYRPGVDTVGYYGDEFPAVARRTIRIVPGLGFLPGTIVDQHFLRRERHNRLLAAVLERPGLIGVGIDESTALQVNPDGGWTIIGESGAVVYDARAAQITGTGAPVLGATGVRMHLLPAGSSFDPRAGRAMLPSDEAFPQPDSGSPRALRSGSPGTARVRMHAAAPVPGTG